MQRLLSARSAKEASRGLVLSGFIVFAQFTLFLLIGVMLFAYYQHVPVPQALTRADQILPIFVVSELSNGLAGFIVAAIVAAALSPSLNAMAATTVSDFYLPYINPSADQATQMRVSKQATVAWGVVQLAVAIGAQWMERSVLDAGLAVLSFASGAVLGAFLLGTLAPKVSERDTFAGMIAGLAVMTAVWWATADGVYVVRADRRGHDLRGGAGNVGRPAAVCRDGVVAVSDTFPTVAAVLDSAIARRVFPGAAVEVGRASGSIATVTRGALTYAPGGRAVATDTIYDLASLTKVIATTATHRRRGQPRSHAHQRSCAALDPVVDRRRTPTRHAAGPAGTLVRTACAPGGTGNSAADGRPLNWRFAKSRSPTCREPSRSTAIPGFMLLGFAIEQADRQTPRSAVRRMARALNFVTTLR